MSENLDEPTRQQVMEFLPEAMKRACAEYHEFMAAVQTPETSKNFIGKHNAGKAAIAHIQLLAKLSQWAVIEKKPFKDEDLDQFLATATKEANSFEVPEQDLV